MRIGRRGCAWLVVCFGLIVSLAAGVSAAPAPPAQRTLRQPGGGQAFAKFGESVAVQGKTLVVGAPAAGDGAPNGPGVVYVFTKNGTKFKLTGKLTASDGAPGDKLGESVAIDGDTIVAGAPGQAADNGDDVGSAYTFARSGGVTRHETAHLVSAAVANSRAGSAVAIDGDDIVVGAPGDAAGIGIVLTYDTTGAPERQPVGYLFGMNDGDARPNFGTAVALDADTIVVGAPGSTVNPSGTGAVFTYDREIVGFPGPTGTLEANSFSGLGNAVAIDGSTIVASALNGGTDGAVFTFSKSGNSVRGPEDELTPKVPSQAVLFGRSVAIDGTRIVVGASGAKKNEGAVFQFARHGAGNRHEQARLLAKNGQRRAQLGSSVAVDGNTLLAGAPSIAAADPIGSATVFYPDHVAPKTLGLDGPEKVAQGSKAKFRFHSNEQGSSFKCKVDSHKAVGCRSPYKFKVKRLRPGSHRFSVFAIDPAGNKDKSPANTSFRVKP